MLLDRHSIAEASQRNEFNIEKQLSIIFELPVTQPKARWKRAASEQLLSKAINETDPWLGGSSARLILLTDETAKE